MKRLFGQRQKVTRYGVKECLADETGLRVWLNKLADDGGRVVSIVPQPNGKLLVVWEYERDAHRT